MTKEEQVLPIHVWWNSMICNRERPSQMPALLMMLYGRPSADEAMARYFQDFDAWRAKWEPKGYGWKS